MPGDSYTKDIARRGSRAIQERKAARQAQSAGTDRALESLGGQVQSADPYAAWYQNRGFENSSYPLALGRTKDGDYAGFRTQGLLDRAIAGYANTERSRDQARMDEMLAVLADKRGDLLGEYATDPFGRPVYGEDGQPVLSEPGAYQQRQDNVFDQFNNKGSWTGRVRGRVDKNAGYERALADLEDWRSNVEGELDKWTQYAEQIRSTPITDYAMLAGQAYGVDPYVIAGMYGPEDILKDASTQADLDSWYRSGMTVDDREQAMNAYDDLAEDQASRSEKMYDEQIRSGIQQVTGVDADALASAAKLSPEELYSVVSSDDYAGFQNQINEAMSAGDEDQAAEAVTNVLDFLRMNDPEMYRVFSAQWGDYFAADGD